MKAVPERDITSFTCVLIVVKERDLLFQNIVRQQYYIVKSTKFLVQHFFPADGLSILE